MRIHAPTAVAAALLGTLTACSSGSGQAATITNPTTTGTGHPAAAANAGYPSTAQLDADLLTVTDLPAGWSSTPDTSKSGGRLSSCPALGGGGHMPANASARFQKSQIGPFVGENLAAGTAAAESADWSRVQSALNTCRTFTSTDVDGTRVNWNLSGLSFPSYGDATYALAVSANASGLTLSGDVILVRKAGVLVNVLALGVNGVDVNTVEGFVTKALSKIG